MLTLVDHAAPSRLREAYLRLRGRDPETDLIVDVQRLAERPAGTTVILAVTPSISADALDWLNLNRPLVADRRLNLVLWCEGDAAAVLARGAPDFFDWISARVDCPPGPAAFAVADVKAAILARAPGIAWAGPALEETLAAVRPCRPIRRLAVASYQSMIDALTSREPGWLFLEGIDAEFHLRRLRWAMAETGRRVIVLRPATSWTYAGWWTVQAEHVPIAAAACDIIAAGGTGRLAALTGLDPAACLFAIFLLQQGSGATALDDALVAAANPREALQRFAGSPGWTQLDVLTKNRLTWLSATMQRALVSDAERHSSDHSWAVSALREQPLDAERWGTLGTAALDFGDFEIAIRWLSLALRSLSDENDRGLCTLLLSQRGQAYRHARELVLARADLERAHSGALRSGDASLIAQSAAALGATLIDQGEPARAREYLESALSSSEELGAGDAATLLETLAVSLVAQRDLAGARQQLERALSIRRSALRTDEHFSIAASMAALGAVLVTQGDANGAQAYLERSLELNERLLGPEHPVIAATLRLLARIQRDTGHLSAARAHLERALAIQRAPRREHQPDLAETLVALSDVLAASGELDDAQAALEDALSVQRKVFGDDGQLAGATTRRELAKVLTARGDLTGAIENLQQALATQRRILEREDHPDVAATQRELERLQALQRDVLRPD